MLLKICTGEGDLLSHSCSDGVIAKEMLPMQVYLSSATMELYGYPSRALNSPMFSREITNTSGPLQFRGWGEIWHGLCASGKQAEEATEYRIGSQPVGNQYLCEL